MTKEEDYLLSNQEIIGGLKAAIFRGESLKDAMMSFYQSGYDKSEIEQAARELMAEQSSKKEELQPGKRNVSVEEKKEEKPVEKKLIPPVKVEKPEEKKTLMPEPIVSNSKTLPLPKIPQKISSYGNKEMEPPKSKGLTIALIFILLILVGLLASIFLFKVELIDFFNNMFS